MNLDNKVGNKIFDIFYYKTMNKIFWKKFLYTKEYVDKIHSYIDPESRIYICIFIKNNLYDSIGK